MSTLLVPMTAETSLIGTPAEKPRGVRVAEIVKPEPAVRVPDDVLADFDDLG